NAAHYQARFNTFQTQWNEQVRTWEAQAASLRGVAVIEHHRSWRYLLDWLGMQPVGELEPKPGLPPSPGHLQNLLVDPDARRARLILYTSFNGDKAARWLASHSSACAGALPYTVGADDDSASLGGVCTTLSTRLVDALEQCPNEDRAVRSSRTCRRRRGTGTGHAYPARSPGIAAWHHLYRPGRCASSGPRCRDRQPLAWRRTRLVTANRCRTGSTDDGDGAALPGKTLARYPGGPDRRQLCAAGLQRTADYCQRSAGWRTYPRPDGRTDSLGRHNTAALAGACDGRGAVVHDPVLLTTAALLYSFRPCRHRRRASGRRLSGICQPDLSGACLPPAGREKICRHCDADWSRWLPCWSRYQPRH